MEDRFRTKKHLSEIFDVPIKTINNDLTEMRRLSQFQQYILKPSHKRLYVSVDGYREFLRYKQKLLEKAM